MNSFRKRKFFTTISLGGVMFATLGVDACQEHYNLDWKARAVTTTTTSTTTTTTDETTTTSPTSSTTTTTEFTDTTTTTISDTTTTTASGSALLLPGSQGSGNTDEDSIGDRDTDRDGLSDDQEKLVGTDSRVPDTDRDGYTDSYELFYESDPLDAASQPAEPTSSALQLLSRKTAKGGIQDSDGDGLPDLTEEELGSDAANPDSDADGLDDGVERLNDTLGLDEQPAITDKDGDGLGDNSETKFGTNSSAADADKDLLPDPDELLLGFNPNDPDTDKNGLLDGYESQPAKYRFLPQQIHF